MSWDVDRAAKRVISFRRRIHRGSKRAILTSDQSTGNSNHSHQVTYAVILPRRVVYLGMATASFFVISSPYGDH